MAKYLSTVMMVSVNTDKCPANTVSHPAARHPQPNYIKVKAIACCEGKIEKIPFNF